MLLSHTVYNSATISVSSSQADELELATEGFEVGLLVRCIVYILLANGICVSYITLAITNGIRAGLAQVISRPRK